MKCSIKIFLLLFFISSLSYAQKIDNLLKALKNSEDTSKVIILNKLSEAYAKVKDKPKKSKKAEKEDKAFEYASKALKYAEEIGYKKGIAVSYYNLGVQYLKKKNLREAELAFLNSVELAKDLKEHQLVLKNFSAIFKFHESVGNVKNAIAYADMKSLYKDVIIKEMQELQENTIKEKVAALKKVSRLDSLIKIKDAKEKENQKALARITEKETVVEYKTATDYRTLAIAIFLLLVMGLVTLRFIQLKNKNARLFVEAQSRLIKLERRLKEINSHNESPDKDKGKQLERSKERLSKEINKLSEEGTQKETNLKTGQLLNHAHFIVQKNELLIEISNSFNGLKESKVEELSNKVSGIEKFIYKNYNTKGDWESFLTYFENAFPDYLSRVKNNFPKLKEQELQLLALLKINLTSYEMSSILHLKEQDIEKCLADLEEIIKREKAV